MPDWQIMEWNESNYDVTKAAYLREAYEARKWAFASDYARFDILRQYGGVYLDTDVELLKPIPEWVLQDRAFTGMESGGFVNPGLIFGCSPNLPVLDAIMDSYDGDYFPADGQIVPKTVNQRVTAILELEGFRREDVIQRVAGLTIYPSEYFCGYDQDIHEPRITENTISRHHYAHSWGNWRDRLWRWVQLALRRAVGTPRYRRLLALKRGLLGVSGADSQAGPLPRKNRRT